MRQHVQQYGQVRTEDKHGNLESNLTIQKFFFQMIVLASIFYQLEKPIIVSPVFFTHTHAIMRHEFIVLK